jgi:hypothetical protein
MVWLGKDGKIGTHPVGQFKPCGNLFDQHRVGREQCAEPADGKGGNIGCALTIDQTVKALRGAASWAGIDLEAEAAQEEAEWHYMMDTQYEDDEAGELDPAMLK